MKKPRPVLHLDSDKMGMAAGAFFATVVMALGFFYSQLTGFEVAFRTALTFVIVYAVTFAFVRILASSAPAESDKKGSRRTRNGASNGTGDQE